MNNATREAIRPCGVIKTNPITKTINIPDLMKNLNPKDLISYIKTDFPKITKIYLATI